MLTNEDVKVLYDFLYQLNRDESVENVFKKLDIIMRQVEIQAQFTKDMNSLNDELKTLEKKEN